MTHNDQANMGSMKNPNWHKQANLTANLTAGRRDADRGFEGNAASRVTEDELDAYRFRGTPIRKPASKVVTLPLPAPPDTESKVP